LTIAPRLLAGDDEAQTLVCIRECLSPPTRRSGSATTPFRPAGSPRPRRIGSDTAAPCSARRLPHSRGDLCSLVKELSKARISPPVYLAPRNPLGGRTLQHTRTIGAVNPQIARQRVFFLGFGGNLSASAPTADSEYSSSFRTVKRALRRSVIDCPRRSYGARS
jgi:hypothetical protein